MILLIVINLLAVLLMSGCDNIPDKKTGGIYMVYQMSKDDFTYEDEYKEGLQNELTNLRLRLLEYCNASISVKKGNIIIWIPEEQDVQKYKRLIMGNSCLYCIPEYDDEGNANFAYQDGEWVLLRDINEIASDETNIITGSDFSSASVQSGMNSYGEEQCVVCCNISHEGNKKIIRMTQKARDNNEQIAMLYDGKIMSAIRVKSVIHNEIAMQVSDLTEANEIAYAISMGTLPHELNLIKCEVYEKSNKGRKKLKK